jgi:hypothetical protein
MQTSKRERNFVMPKETTAPIVPPKPEHDFTRPMIGDHPDTQARRAAAAEYVERTLPALAVTIGKLRAAATGLADYHMRGRNHEEHARFVRIESAATEFLNLIR